MVPCLRHSTICRRYSCFTFRLRRNSHSYRLVGKCPRIRPSELARLCVRLPSFHSKYILIITHFKKLFQSFNRSVMKNRYYSAMHLGFTQLTLLPAAIAAESSIRAKRPRLKNDKTSLQASLRSTLCFGRRRADVHRTSCAKFLSSSAAWLNSYINILISENIL